MIIDGHSNLGVKSVLNILIRPVFLIAAIPAAFILSISIDFFSSSDINIYNSLLYVRAVFLILVIYAALTVISLLMRPVSFLLFGNGQNILRLGTGKVYFLFCIILTLTFFPALLALYPGFSAYDGPLQVILYLYSGKINSTQPVIHTLLMITALKLGNFLTGNGNTGILIYSIIQAIIVILLSSAVGVVILGWGCRTPVGIAALFFTAAMPYIQLFTFITTKDSIFSPLFLLWLVLTADMIRKRDKKIGFRPWFFYFLTGVFMCLFRSQGLYIFVIGTFIILITHRKKLLPWTLTLLSVTICIILITGPFYRAVGIVVPGQVAEKLSIPIQQIGRVLNLEKDTISADDQEALSHFMDMESVSKYIPQISDPLKTSSAFNTDYYSEHKAEFWKTYARIGMSHPKIYLDAFFYMTEGYFYPGLGYEHPWSVLGDYISVDVEGYQSYLDPKLPSYSTFLLKDTGKLLLRNYPVIGYLSTISFPIWYFYAFLVILFERWLRKYKEHDSERTDTYAAMTVVLFMNFFAAILLLGPTCTIRYVIPEYFSIPVLTVLCGLGFSK